MSNYEDMPDPRPSRHIPPLTDLSFAALGWLYRGTQAVGHVRFNECAKRARFYLETAARHAATPAEVAVITGMASSLEGLIQADADAREVLTASLAGLEAVLGTESLPSEAESADAAEDIEPEEHDASQDPAAGSCET